MFKVKNKCSVRSFWWFYCWFWPQSAYQYSVSTFNFEQVVPSWVWKTSHNVLKTQKAIYLFRNKSCKAYSIQWFIIALNWNKLWSYNQRFSSKFALGIPSVLSLFYPVICSVMSSLFSRDLIFLALSNWKPIQIIETLKQIGMYLNILRW